MCMIGLWTILSILLPIWYVISITVQVLILIVSLQVVFLNCRTVDPPVAPYLNPTGFVEEWDDKRKDKSHLLLKTYVEKLKPYNVSIFLCFVETYCIEFLPVLDCYQSDRFTGWTKKWNCSQSNRTQCGCAIDWLASIGYG